MSKAAEGMPCPVDGTNLVISERSGIEIDYCPTSRGVWLDRGELDKIIERNAAAVPEQQSVRSHSGFESGGMQQGRGYDSRQSGHRKRKKSFLEELFD